MLKINHPIYGLATIHEPALIALIKSPAMQRLKHIEQHGTWQFHRDYRAKNRFTRYQHSIGVMLLLRKFNASLAEQIHGLLHDISHTAFSHVSDFVFESDPMKHDYQDSKTEKAYELQGVNKILKAHGLKPNYILNEKNFPLAERDLPDLCADRIDYTLQDPWGWELYRTDRKKILADLVVYKKQFVFKTRRAAKQFAELNFQLNKQVWCNPLQVAIYDISAQAIRQALDSQVITKKDLYQTDAFVANKLRRAANPLVRQNFKRLKNLKIESVKSKQQADLCRSSKPRVVDPSFLENNRLVKLTSVDKAYKTKTAKWQAGVKRGFYIKILNS